MNYVREGVINPYHEPSIITDLFSPSRRPLSFVRYSYCSTVYCQRKHQPQPLINTITTTTNHQLEKVFIGLPEIKF